MDTQKKREVITNLKEWISEIEADIKADIKDEVTPWEPPPGDWWISGLGKVSRTASVNESRLFGVERPTEPLALKAAEKMRRFNVLLAYIDKYAPDYEPDWSNHVEPKFYPLCNHKTGKWVRQRDYQIEGVNPYGPRDVIDGLIENLNRGEIVL